MAKERPKNQRARLFIALELPEDVRAGIAAWGEEALADPALRPLRSESLHITLAFLGYLPQKEVPRLREIVEASRAAAPSIVLADPVPRPEHGRPRLFALPAKSRGTIALQRTLERKLVAAGLCEAEKRPFWPHVTVARVRREERGSKRPALVSRPPKALPKDLSQEFHGVRLTLYLSQIQPQGALYTPLAQVELPAGGQQ